MYPVLFKIGNIEIQSYVVIWGLAVCIAIFYSNRRIAKNKLPIEQTSFVIAWTFLVMLIGARLFEYIWNWHEYFISPSLLFDFGRGELSEVGAIMGTMVSAYFLCQVKKISFWQFADTLSPGILLVIAIGRWGCYLNGCCSGIEGYAVQLYYSFSATGILIFVLLVEKNLKNSYPDQRVGCWVKGLCPLYGILSPIGLGLYSVSRLLIDPLRLDYNTGGMIATQSALIGCATLSLLWIACSCREIFTKKSSRLTS